MIHDSCFRVLGIDPGYERLGMAVVEKQNNKETVVYSDCFHTSAKIPFCERLFLLGEKTRLVIEEYSPQALAIETLMFNTNQKTAIHVAEARGVILYEAARKKLEVYEFTPLQIKVAITGHGRSDKKQITEMVKKLVKIEKKEALDDEYDAIACALTCLASYRVLGLKI
jgi:crossover junction endodeoxyribonuclease RuvC